MAINPSNAARAAFERFRRQGRIGAARELIFHLPASPIEVELGTTVHLKYAVEGGGSPWLAIIARGSPIEHMALPVHGMVEICAWQSVSLRFNSHDDEGRVRQRMVEIIVEWAKLPRMPRLDTVQLLNEGEQ